MINMDLMIKDLIRDEGLKLKPYMDTEGKLTIGIGRNLDDVGISRTEAAHLCSNDVLNAIQGLDDNFPWWRKIGDVRQRALLNMAFNLGLPRLKQFRMMLAALESGEWEAAAREALDSKWAEQVGDRAKRIARDFVENKE